MESLSINAAGDDGRDDSNAPHWRLENVTKLVGYFSDFTVDWAAP